MLKVFNKMFPLENPSPDFTEFKAVIKGTKELCRVHFFELLIDAEVIALMSEKMMARKLPSLINIIKDKVRDFHTGKKVVLLSQSREKLFCQDYVDFYYHMGYDCLPEPYLLLTVNAILESLLPKIRRSVDTAHISRDERTWAEEGKGIITSWEEFEAFPWEKMNLEFEDYYRFLGQKLPQGMKLTVTMPFFEQVLEKLLGYEGLFYLIYDQPDLIEAVFDQWGQIVYSYYKQVVSLPSVGVIFHGDDLGYKTATMLRPDTLRKLVFPWFKKYASLAHKHEKMFFLHSCGNVLEIMEDLIEDVGIDGKHSFEDVIIPVTEFKRRYGTRIGTLGGVDMDKLCRLGKEAVRQYVREILDQCMPGGRYVLGSGNSVANYVPVENYLVMLEEGMKW